MSAPSITDPGGSVYYDSIYMPVTITSQGSTPVTECGVVIALTATNATPTIGGTGVTKVPASGTTGLQDVYVTGLSNGSGYSYRSFATNGTGTTYGTVRTDTPAGAPGSPAFVDSTYEITDAGILIEGHIHSGQGSAISARGFVYSLTSVDANPESGETGVTTVSDGSGIGRFSETFDLDPGDYSIRAWATNGLGTYYTDQIIDFEIPGPPLVTTTKVIATKPGPWSDPPAIMVLAKPVVETTPSGWDSMRERLLVPYSPYFAPGQRRDHMLDERAQPFAHMIMQEERIVGFKGQWPEVELVSLGFAREKPWTIQTTADSQGEVGSSGGVIRNLPTFTLVWFSATLEDTKAVIPSAAVPPETFGWQAVAITSGLGNNYGFVLVKRDIDPLPVMTGSTPQAAPGSSGSTRANANLNPRPTLCRVTDYYVYDMVNALPPND